MVFYGETARFVKSILIHAFVGNALMLMYEMCWSILLFYSTTVLYYTVILLFYSTTVLYYTVMFTQAIARERGGESIFFSLSLENMFFKGTVLQKYLYTFL